MTDHRWNEHSLTVLVDDLRSFADERPVVVLRTSKAAIEWLKAEPDRSIDHLWLDHDLGFPEGEEDSGRRVVAELEEHHYDIEQIMVHSQNPYGARVMFDALVRAGYDTYLWTDHSSKMWKFEGESW